MYYVYQLINPKTQQPFYIGKGKGDRAYTHAKLKDGNNNFRKDTYIKNLLEENLEPVVDIVKYFDIEDEAYAYEEQLIESIGIHNLTNMVSDARPPSQKGRKKSPETLAKQSASLKGIPRTKEWRDKLSKSKTGTNNPRYGIKEDPKLTERRRLAVIRTKNAPNYELYKTLILRLNAGESATSLAKKTGVGKGVVCKLKNRTHGIFLAFPELI